MKYNWIHFIKTNIDNQSLPLANLLNFAIYLCFGFSKLLCVFSVELWSDLFLTPPQLEIPHWHREISHCGNIYTRVTEKRYKLGHLVPGKPVVKPILVHSGMTQTY
jgi:hypothetical protein